MSSKHETKKQTVRKILFAASTALAIGATGTAEANKGVPFYGMPARPTTHHGKPPLYGMPARPHKGGVSVNPIGNPGPLPPGLGSPVPNAGGGPKGGAPLHGMIARPTGKK